MRGQTINTLRAIIVVLIVFFVLIMILDFVYDIDVAGAFQGKGVCGDGICQDGEEIECPQDCGEIFADASVSHLVIEDSSGTTFTWDDLVGSGGYFDFPESGSKEDCWDCTECYQCKDTQVFVNGLKCTGCDEYGCGTKRIIDESGKTVEIDGEEYPVTYPDDTCYYCDSCESAESDYSLGNKFEFNECQSCYDCKNCKEAEGIFWECDGCDICESCETNRYDCTGCTDCPDAFEGEECFDCAFCSGDTPGTSNAFTFCTGCDGFENCEVCEERTRFEKCEYCSSFLSNDNSFTGCRGCYFGDLPDQTDESIEEYGWNECGECVSCSSCEHGVETLFCERLKECIGNANEEPCFIDEDIAVSLIGESFGYSGALSSANGRLGDVLEDAVQRCLEDNLYKELVEGGRQFVCYYDQSVYNSIDSSFHSGVEEKYIYTDCGNINNDVNLVHFNTETTYDSPIGFHFNLIVSNVDYNIGQGDYSPPCEFALQVCSQASVTTDPFDPILEIYKKFVFFDVSGYDLGKYQALAWVYDECERGNLGDKGCESGDDHSQSRVIDSDDKNYYKGVFLMETHRPKGASKDYRGVTVEGFDTFDGTGEGTLLSEFNAWEDSEYIYFQDFDQEIDVNSVKATIDLGDDSLGEPATWGTRDFYYAMFSMEDAFSNEIGVGAAKFNEYLVDITLSGEYETGQITETIATAVKDWNSVHRDDVKYAKEFAIKDLKLVEFITGPQDETDEEYESNLGNMNYIYFEDTPWNIQSLDLNDKCWSDDQTLINAWVMEGTERNIVFDKSSNSPNFEDSDGDGEIDIIKPGKLKVRFGYVVDFKQSKNNIEKMDIVLYPLFTVCGGV